MYDSWTVLMVQKGPGILPENIRNGLKLAACTLSYRKQDILRIKTPLISGIIETEWKSHLVGTKGGVLFRSQIDCEDGTDYLVNFLISSTDLNRGAEIIRALEEEQGEDGIWGRLTERIPVPELYKFHDLRGPSTRLQ